MFVFKAKNYLKTVSDDYITSRNVHFTYPHYVESFTVLPEKKNANILYSRARG